MVRLAIDLQKTAQWGALLLYTGNVGWILLGIYVNPWFHIGTIITTPVTLYNLYLKHVQCKHALLRNFGILAQFRYLFESIAPEMRQYFFSSDTEERPFNRNERAEVYQKAKDIDSTTSFGTQQDFTGEETKIRHSMFPMKKKDVEPFSVTFGKEREIKTAYTITQPMMISAMSFGSLGARAITSLSKGAKKAGIPMNTGEGGLSPYHIKGGADIIFQMGTGKFGVRTKDGHLDDAKLRGIAAHPHVKMIEIKFSQGAKPGKGGLLPGEKVTAEIARIRGVHQGKDVVSPERHIECDTPENTVKFIKHVQDISELPVGVKMCIGREDELRTFIKEMKRQDVFPDYIAVDGMEGGTGAAPKSFMDNVGVPLIPGLDLMNSILVEEKVRDKLKLVASGKLISAGKQINAIAHGANAIYSARGFMLALGCIQALQCNRGTCPVGITTHDDVLQRGIVIEDK
ncbi:TPA: FMN-binding glutamate synthase family protein, partial [Candidatus Woesearchaeota archaeon]|nr:FMN-binding glutamate synthase family protein [Candidatus Woesearchaeota archaeon]